MTMIDPILQSADVPIPRQRIETVGFSFVGFGSAARSPIGSIWTSATSWRPGVIDHHQLAAFRGSAAESDREPIPRAGPGERPQVDPRPVPTARSRSSCMPIPTWIARSRPTWLPPILRTGAATAGNRIARALTSTGVDGGHVRHDPAASIHSVFCFASVIGPLAEVSFCPDLENPRRLLAGDASGEGSSAGRVSWPRSSPRASCPILEVDAFHCPGLLFGPHDRAEIRKDMERYRSKLRDPANHARQERLRLPGRFDGTTRRSIRAWFRTCKRSDDADLRALLQGLGPHRPRAEAQSPRRVRRPLGLHVEGRVGCKESPGASSRSAPTPGPACAGWGPGSTRPNRCGGEASTAWMTVVEDPTVPPATFPRRHGL